MEQGLATKGLNAYAVLWAANGNDDRGQIQVLPPVQIRCRWQQGSRLSTESLSQRVAITATVDVDRSIKVGSILSPITLSQLGDESTVVHLELYRVEEYSEVPDIKHRKSRKSVQLSSYHNSLPTIGA